MILYKQKPKKMILGGLISAAGSISDWIADYDETSKWAQTGATIIDPAGTAIDILGDENASSSDKVEASVNAIMPGIGAFEVGEDTADRNQDQINTETQKKRKADQDKLNKKSVENYAMQYQSMVNPEGGTGITNTTAKPTVTTWYNQ